MLKSVKKIIARYIGNTWIKQVISRSAETAGKIKIVAAGVMTAALVGKFPITFPGHFIQMMQRDPYPGTNNVL